MRQWLRTCMIGSDGCAHDSMRDSTLYTIVSANPEQTGPQRSRNTRTQAHSQGQCPHSQSRHTTSSQGKPFYLLWLAKAVQGATCTGMARYIASQNKPQL